MVVVRFCSYAARTLDLAHHALNGWACATVQQIGNKCDRETWRKVSVDEGVAFAREVGALWCALHCVPSVCVSLQYGVRCNTRHEVSAKRESGITELFDELVPAHPHTRACIRTHAPRTPHSPHAIPRMAKTGTKTAALTAAPSHQVGACRGVPIASAAYIPGGRPKAQTANSKLNRAGSSNRLAG